MTDRNIDKHIKNIYQQRHTQLCASMVGERLNDYDPYLITL